MGYKKCFLNKICPFLAHSVPVALCFVGVHSFQSLSSKVLQWAVFMKQNLRFGPFGQFSSCISYTWQSTITSNDIYFYITTLCCPNVHVASAIMDRLGGP